MFNNYSTSEALELVTMAATHANDTMKKNVSERLNLLYRKKNYDHGLKRIMRLLKFITSESWNFTWKIYISVGLSDLLHSHMNVLYSVVAS